MTVYGFLELGISQVATGRKEKVRVLDANVTRMVECAPSRPFKKRMAEKLGKAQGTRVTRLPAMIGKFCFDASAVTAKPARRDVKHRNTKASRRAPAQPEQVIRLHDESDAGSAERTVVMCNAEAVQKSVRVKVPNCKRNTPFEAAEAPLPMTRAPKARLRQHSPSVYDCSKDFDRLLLWMKMRM